MFHIQVFQHFKQLQYSIAQLFLRELKLNKELLTDQETLNWHEKDCSSPSGGLLLHSGYGEDNNNGN